MNYEHSSKGGGQLNIRIASMTLIQVTMLLDRILDVVVLLYRQLLEFDTKIVPTRSCLIMIDAFERVE